TRNEVSNFLADEGWLDESRWELMAVLYLPGGAGEENTAQMRLAELDARRGYPESAAEHMQIALDKLATEEHPHVTMTNRGEELPGDARDFLKAEMLCWYIQAAQARGDTSEMERRLDLIMQSP